MNRCSTLILLVLSLSLNAVHANVVGADTQNFNPTNDGLDFVTVHSSETLEPGLLNLGFFLNYAVNSLPNYVDANNQTRTNFNDSLLSADMNFAVGLMRNWEAGFSFPFLLSQSVDSDVNTFRGEFAQNGLTEIRLMTKYRLLGDSAGGVAGVFSVNFNQIEDNPFLGEDAGPTYNFELAADTTMGLFGVGANVGYRVRNPGRQLAGIPVVPFDDQYIGSLAINYLTQWQVKVIGEIFGSWPVEESRFSSDRDDSSLEALLGIKADLTQSIAFHFGGGTEIFQGTSSPDWRVYTGINWVLGPLFSEKREVFVKVKGREFKNLEDIDTEDPFAGAPDVDEAFLARDVLFEFNSDRLQPEAIESLKRLVTYLSRPPGLTTLTVEGHTDSVGSAVYNENLSQRRADSVRKALISVGLNASKVKAIGYGEARPIADNGNFQGRAMNRRVEFKVKR